MPEKSYMFIFSVLLQAVAAFLTKAPEFLEQQQEKLEDNHMNTKNKKWKINEELSLRALIIHQLIRHLRSFYGELIVMRYVLFFFIVVTIFSTTVFLIISPATLTNEAVMAFILIFIGFSCLVSSPSIFCFLLSWLVVKSKPEN